MKSERGDDDDGLRLQDRDAQDVDAALQRVDGGVGLDALAVQAAHAVRDEQRRPDGGDERDEPRRASQRTVGDPLQDDGDDGRVSMETAKMTARATTGSR